MDALGAAGVLCQSIITWAEKVKALKPQCKAVRGQVETLLPLLEKYADELGGNASGFADHDARWVTNLVVALTGAEDAVDQAGRRFKLVFTGGGGAHDPPTVKYEPL